MSFACYRCSTSQDIVPDMAAANSQQCNEQFLCSICLEVFKEPVSTPCGHNYCKQCITRCWDTSEEVKCPLCKQNFPQRPQLQVNTGFRDMVAQFSNMGMRRENAIIDTPREVACDVCLGQKTKAQKTCLFCALSFCHTHLEPHQSVPNLRRHKLIDPVDRLCKKHNENLKYFCQDDQMCVCRMCLRDDHAEHEAVLLEDAFEERQAQLVSTTSEIEMIENAKSGRINDIRRSTMQSGEQLEEAIACISAIFTALEDSLQRSQTELIEVIQEKQRAAEEQAEAHVTHLENELDELRGKRFEIELLLQTEDHLLLLQSCLPSPTSAASRDLSDSPSVPVLGSHDSQQGYVEMVGTVVAQMEQTVSNEMEKLINDIRLSDSSQAAAQSDESPDSPEILIIVRSRSHD